MLLTPRDLEILRWIGRHGIVSAAQITTRYFGSPRAAYRRIQALIAHGALRRDPTYWREPFVLRLTPAGARLADLGLAPATLVLADVRHSLALVDLTERLHAAHPGSTLITEREVRAARLRARREGRRTAGGRIPDGVLALPTGERVAIELDLTPKRPFAVARVIAAYSDLHEPPPADAGFSSVWWYVRPATCDRMRALIEEEHVDDFISIRPWPDDTPAGD